MAVWGDRRIDAPTVSEFKHLAATLVSTRVVRRSDRGGHSTKEHFFHAIRCLYRFAVDDGHIAATEDPSAKLDKPRPRPSNRRALPADLLEEICRVAVVTSDDPELDSLILRLHIETACRLEGALNLRLQDLDPTQCLIRLREKGDKERWQPVSPTLMAGLLRHYHERISLPGATRPKSRNGRRVSAAAHQRLLRYSYGPPISKRRYDTLWARIGTELEVVAIQGITTHWLRHTTLRWVERNFGYSVAKAFAGHAHTHGLGATTVYTRAGIEEIAEALAGLTGEPHPLPLGQVCNGTPLTEPHPSRAQR